MLTTHQKIFMAKVANRMILVARKLVGLKMVGEFRRSGCRWHLDLNEGIDFAIFLFGSFEPRLIKAYRRFIKPGDTVIDIGANIGAHTLIFAKAVGAQGKVCAIEATEYAYGKLTRNLGLNPELKAVSVPFHMLLDESEDADGEGAIYSSWPLTGTTDKHDIHGGCLQSVGEAKVGTLDGLVTELKLEKIDCIKLDVDGNELKVLRGAVDTLRKYKPFILMEMAPDYYASGGDGTFAELVELLSGVGYKLYTIPGNRSLPLEAEALGRVIAEGASINVLLKCE